LEPNRSWQVLVLSIRLSILGMLVAPLVPALLAELAHFVTRARRQRRH